MMRYPYSILSKFSPILFTVSLCAASATTAYAKINQEQSLVDHATLAIQDIYTDVPVSSMLYKRLQDSRAVMICPNIVQMSLIFGGSGGDCVLLSRDAKGSWSSPAFYSMSSGSFGIQLGVQNTKIMLFIMTEHSLHSILDSQFTMGANASATAASSSSNADSGAAGTKMEIYTVQKSSGLFAGAALKGSKFNINSTANYAYYKQPVGPEDIVIAMRVNNPSADPLRRMLIQLSSRSYSSQSPSTNQPSQENGRIELAPSSHSNTGVKSESLPPLK